ncbi:DUF3813 domain-containing protein [Mangrovibacillus cuniculi]|uniref:DUF3813 domain-containing protein n=1 Tax=Mangrovibacillus cuniculi TaxID=2593652 RepID=A0A7S8C9T4_9BACI|nr:DUF3813 domain-containing protein [Mangrovibacillus cuniculi]QPC46052.1 DUF3813 domain-containing protein [Mangrovibacillus cuniculi]
MGNQLFQQAKQHVEEACQCATGNRDSFEKAYAKAQNSLSSAFANSTDAEKKQLQAYQNELDTLV